jgi:hypothetical protein
MLLAGAPPAEEKDPPATTSPFGRAAKAYTTLFIPDPKGDHDEPFQRATRWADPPPADANDPPATMSLCGSIESEWTTPFSPYPREVHDEPFHFAT